MAAGSRQYGQVGRRPATTKNRISQVGIELFTEQGFDETSIDQIAEAAGIARRTFFRYFPSKNAVPWGDFDVHLAEMREQLGEIPRETALADALTGALLNFNRFPDDQTELHRKRMALILSVPALQGYSMVLYEDWRNVVAEYVATRMGTDVTCHGPRTVGWLLLAVAMAAYEQWLSDDAASLPDLLEVGARTLHGGLAELEVVSPGSRQ